jgi:hypothetical protein
VGCLDPEASTLLLWGRVHFDFFCDVFAALSETAGFCIMDGWDGCELNAQVKIIKQSKRF